MKGHVVLIFTLLLAACAHVSLPPERECERLHARLAYCLIEPAALADPEERLDRVEVRSPEGRQTFIGQIAFDSERTLLVGQSQTGMGLFRIEWDGTRLQQSVRSEEMGLDGRRLLALIQLVFASPDQLATAVIGGRVSDRAMDDGRERRLTLDGGRLLARIHYAPDGEITVEFADELYIRMSPL
ncbi:DUF3261 domain-containing protein [Natronospira bacteriovora]|uniref:DUF3261 domain-containing protein n=1 Tax=Natronospira bacteriovora TaxID=3069753 RepID=A0ABU0W972_9GAMM|nr:DUF3261 domain-containing protein [Natronospira sp. AB-CW4]MDQ2069985.1 DUF3261 domain-containing protein [Natronospira sp. AB-CW4]